MVKPKRRHIKKNKQSSAIIVYKCIIYVFLVAIFGTFFLKLVTPIISNTANVLGVSSFFAKGGDDDNSGTGSSGSGSSGESRDSDDDSGSGSSRSNNSGSSGTSASTSNTNVSSDDDEDEKRTGVKTKPNETRTEIRLPEGERIRARTKDGRTRIDITESGVKTRLEIRADRVVLKAEREDGTEEELDDETLDEVKVRLAQSDINIATEGGEVVIAKRHLGARTQFPLSIDLSTNTLIVTTPAGQKAVAVLPDVAVRNILTKGILSKIGGGIVSPSGGLDRGSDATGKAGLVAETESVEEELEEPVLLADSITLEEEDGELVYKMEGISDQRLFGFIPVLIERTIAVSAETGDVASVRSPLFDRILDIISI
ncbi:MAG: hypothetical protein A3C27_02200 [Candidatus Levybacteria bacterium RIFCSPHIGHO2_02_FULL_39_36]|nr:MAG: Zinc knuckle domain-containing protein [Candidatus Levybacteria bacterium GW2011_GWA1_39_11]OGH15270.1 MAG: hypothetical protein A2689_00620 [Candidatus Levybacteria bacterium RIFCSPHIGHO2_01_FULL_38_96]OGH25418.1 MAG: hypothetical protein A3E68_02920 [Candidatus Levybacteria bacterium RIFCSPHIGHO2_12_FULL_39_39]OGH28131.1 MAG: hypothetical protein A3C27_02200 [Candidatus Levybacteria bacterium RIFCSPHIGHO2_02_FULL_39_36]OGH36177.1 MAG: hypothetical protein A3B43_02010 [Candidatus Levyb